MMLPSPSTARPPPHPRRRSGPSTAWFNVALIVALGALGLWLVQSLVPALVWALVLAIALDPVLIRARAARPGTGWNLVVTSAIVAVVAVVVIVPLALGITQAALEARQVSLWLATAKAQGLPPPAALAALPEVGPALARWWQMHLGTPAAATRELDGIAAANVIEQTRSIGGNLLHRAVIFGFTLLALFFLLRDRDAILGQAHTAADRLLGPRGERIGRQAILSVRGTIDGLILVGLGEGAVMTMVYALLGTPHPVLLGVLTAVAATIPFGAAVMFLIAAALLLGAGSAASAVAVIAIGLVVVAIADHVVRPALIGGATRLPFVWVLIGIIGGAETLGVLGLFVGPAAMAVLVMLWRDLVAPADTPIPGDD